MKSTTFLFGIALSISSIAVNDRLDASGGPARDIQPEQHASHSSSPPSRLVELVREATDAFRFTIPAEYQQFLGCVSGPEEGAMGVHFVNFALVDGEARPQSTRGSDL